MANLQIKILLIFEDYIQAFLGFRAPMIKVSDKVMIPQEHHPDINFMGLIIGPRGNTLKALEKETGAKVRIEASDIFLGIYYVKYYGVGGGGGGGKGKI